MVENSFQFRIKLIKNSDEDTTMRVSNLAMADMGACGTNIFIKIQQQRWTGWIEIVSRYIYSFNPTTLFSAQRSTLNNSTSPTNI